MQNASSLAERAHELSERQRSIAAHDGPAPLCVTGPPGSGKTVALAALAARWVERGIVIVICPNRSSCDAFAAALSRYDSVERVAVDTLAGHLARWMRSESVASGASPDLTIGGDADSDALALDAARPILDMTWTGFRDPEFSLDLPFLARPGAFFEHAASAFRQLRRWLVEPDAFEAGCAAGLGEFYGADVEKARDRCANPSVRSRASYRGRNALAATVAQLRTQRRAERDLASVLGHVYRAYVAGARGRRVLCPVDVIAEGLAWLASDDDARARLAARCAAIIVDDAEDAEPASADLVKILRAAGDIRVAAASCAASAIDGIGGRRALALDDSTTIDVSATRPAAQVTANRCGDEAEEADAIAVAINRLLAEGAMPSDIVVLARDEAAAAVYARSLAQRGVPLTAPPNAWQAPADILDLLALACVVDDPYDHAHLLRVLASPVVGLSDLSLLAVCRDPTDADQLSLDVGLDDTVVGGGRGPATTTLAQNVLYGLADRRLADHARLSLAAFRTSWRTWRAACARMGPAAALAYLIDAAGFDGAWHAAAPHLRRRLRADAARIIAGAARTSGGLVEVARALESGAASIAPAERTDDAIACGTIVDAKGRRAPHVFVAGVSHGRFPRVYVSRAIAYSKQWGLIARENVAGGASQTAKFAWYYARYGAKQLFVEEERRALAYAVARADVGAHVSGFGKPPRWAADQDLLAAYGV